MRKSLLPFVVLLSGGLHADSQNLDQAVWMDSSTIPPTFHYTWWGTSGMHYLVEVSADLLAWTFLPDYNPSGTDATLGIEFTVDTQTTRQFARVWQFDPTDTSGIADTDGDGLPDKWELYYFGNLDRDGMGDFDADGLSDLFEFQGGGHPKISPVTAPTDRANIGYDSAGRLETVSIPWSMSFSFDDEGSILSVQ